MRELPEGWAICKLGDYIKLKNGFAFKSQDYIEKKSDTFPVIRISDIDGQYASDLNAVHISKNQVVEGFEVESGDLLIAMSGATTGKIGVYIGVSIAYQNQRVGNLRLISEADGCSSFRNHLISRLSGKILEDAYGGAQPNISGKAIEDLEIPLPPLNEQKRIADRLDQLLTRIDKTKAHLDRIPPLLKRFRQSVLAAATSGKLTEDWREERSLGFDWDETDIQSVAKVGTGSTPLKSNSSFYTENGIPWVTSAATGYTYVTSAFEFVTEAAIIEHRLKIYPIGTLLVAMYGEGKIRGQVSELSIEATINQACAAITANELLAARNYIKLALQSNYFKMREMAEGGNQPNLNLSKIKEFPILLPTLEEQQEIVRRVEALFVKADRIEAQYKNARQQVDRLTPALLAKAFRGELVPQDPNDEPASVLLERVKEARSIAQPAKAKRKAVK